MAHGLVFAGIGPELGAIQRHRPQANQPCLLAQPQYLNEQSGQLIKMSATEISDPSVVWLLVPGQHPESGDLPASLLDLPGAGQSNAVGVQEHHHQPLRGRLRLHPGLVRLLTPWALLPVDGMDGFQIQLSDQIQQGEHQVVLRQPVHRRWRQQQRLLGVPGAERFELSHTPFSRSEPLRSRGSGQIQGRLWRGRAWIYARHALSLMPCRLRLRPLDLLG